DGKAQVGVFRRGSWFIDNGNFKWEGCDVDHCSGFGQATATPFVGDFNGDGKAQIGVADGAFWAIDDGDGAWGGCGKERCGRNFGEPGDTPLVGRWGFVCKSKR